MRQPRARLTEQDRAVWFGYASTVRPLAGRPAILAPPAARPAAPPASRPGDTPAGPSPASHDRPGVLVIGQAPAGLDRSTWKRLAGGGLVPDRRIDLHGLTVQRAFDRFAAILQASAGKARCIEVITGRGTGEEGGALRRELPLWLNRPDFRPFILAAAHPHRRNVGSVLVLLRRR